MNKQRVIILGIIGTLLLGGILFTVIVANQQQEIRSNAQAVPTPTTAVCPAPDAVQNVIIDYPNCTGQTVGSTCDYVTASCSWSPVTTASTYTVKVTEVETGTVVKNNEQQNSSTTKITFPVNQGKTYKCDVFATNSCGTNGGVGTFSLLCKADALLTTPTPVITTAPTTAPTPTPVTLACGFTPCNVNAKCQTGLVCIITNNNQGYCAFPQYQTACKNSPSTASCCTPPAAPTTPPNSPPNSSPSAVVQPTAWPTQIAVVPTAIPTLPATGDTSPVILVGSIGAALTIIGGILAFFVL